MRARWRWWLVAVVALPVLIVGVEHGRGRWVLARTQRRLEDGGAVLDPRKLRPATDPKATEGMAALTAALDALGADAWLTPPLLIQVGPGSFVPGSAVPASASFKGAMTPERFAEWYRTNGSANDAIARAMAAAARQPGSAGIEPEPGYLRQMGMAGEEKHSAVGRFLAFTALVEAGLGREDEAIRRLKWIQALDRDLLAMPVWDAQATRAVLNTLLCDTVAALLLQGSAGESGLAQIQDLLTSPGYVEPFLRYVDHERGEASDWLRSLPNRDVEEIAMMAWADDGRRGGGPGAGLADSWPKVRESLQRNAIFPVWRFGWGDLAVARYLEECEILQKAVRAGAQARSDAGFRAALPSKQWPELGFGDRWTGPYAYVLTMNLPVMLRRSFECECRLSITRAAVALERHRLRHGRLPESLGALVPELLREVPVDWMDGKPVRYRRLSEDAFVLWGVGLDGQDDGGRAAALGPDRTANWYPASGDRGPDAVWPRKATPDEIKGWLEKAGRDGGEVMSEALRRRYGLMPAK